MDEKQEFENELNFGFNILRPSEFDTGEIPESTLIDIQKHILYDIGLMWEILIRSFFTDKEMYYGGPIPEQVLLAPIYTEFKEDFDWFTIYDIFDGTSVIYQVLKENLDICPTPKDSSIPPDIQMVLNVREACGRINLPMVFDELIVNQEVLITNKKIMDRFPRQLIPGITLIYLELCKGVEIDC